MMPHAEAGKAALAWWTDLHPDPSRDRSGDRGALARLRRCATVAEAMQEPAAILLFRRLHGAGARDLPQAALAAAVLAHVRENRSGRVARLVGPGSIETPDTAVLKPLRFRRLMETDGWDERLTAFRRLVGMAGGKLPIDDLALALLYWTDTRRQQWVLDYWNALPSETAPARPGLFAKDSAAKDAVAREPAANEPVAKEPTP